MSHWLPSEFKPDRPGIYRVRVSYLMAGEGFARWTGDYWCCVANTEKRAELCYWRGPAGGYDWRPL